MAATGLSVAAFAAPFAPNNPAPSVIGPAPGAATGYLYSGGTSGQLTRTAFDEVLAMLSGKYPSDVAAELDARISWDRVTDTLTASRASRMVAVISGGTIPDRGLYTVNLADKTRLGELDEALAEYREALAIYLPAPTAR